VDLARYLLREIDALAADRHSWPSAAHRRDGQHQRVGATQVVEARTRDQPVRFASGARVLRAICSGRRLDSRSRHQARSGLPADELGVSLGGDNPAARTGGHHDASDRAASTAVPAGSATSIDYDGLKVIEAYNFLRSIAGGAAARRSTTRSRRGARRVAGRLDRTWVSLPADAARGRCDGHR
jgi:hypothetical protein